jgi:hypothetical protein
MIAVRIGPDQRTAVVGAPSYLETGSEPERPQELVEHNCINLRRAAAFTPGSSKRTGAN